MLYLLIIYIFLLILMYNLLKSVFLLTSYLILDLRRQARHLENEIDAKLVAFSKLGVNSGSKLVNGDEEPLLDEEHVFDNMASEIEALLAKVRLKYQYYISKI